MAIKHVGDAEKRKQFTSYGQKKDKSMRGKHVKEDVTSLLPGENKKNGFFYVISLFSLAFGFGCLHIYHVSTMFENDRHFSHLSMLEREMTFRTEMGLYYSFYKRIIEAPTFHEGFLQITNDNLTEYPNVINTLQRFNLYPEVIIALLYRTYLYVMDFFSWSSKQCWQIDRGRNLSPVTSCEGLGDPTYFYLEMVWLCAGMTVALLFIYGIVVSRSIIGGFLTVICFLYNHSECTRVQWSPPLRESFAYPFILLQLLCLTYFLRKNHKISGIQGTGQRILQMIVIYLTTWICLTLWQFSQFIMVTQVIAVFIMLILAMIKKDMFLLIIFGQILGVAHAIISLYGNKLLVCSLLSALLISVLLVVLFLEPLLGRCHIVLRGFLLLSLTAAGTLLLKCALNMAFNNRDDDHIINILKSKLTDFKDFHSLMYTCSAEFDFMGFDVIKRLSKTLLIPTTIMALTFVSIHWVKCYLNNRKKLLGNQTKKTEREKSLLHFVEPEIFYNILQLVAFTMMAVFIMRLKLFFTPQLCILVALLATRKFYPFFRDVETHWALVAVTVGLMSFNGVTNLNSQRDILGEYSNAPLEELLMWVKTDTKPNAVFAGPMPTMANLLLSTRRPIVNHPHYEDADLRERTKLVYSVFSRRSVQDVFVTLLNMKVEYVVIDESWCFRESRKGCSMLDIWDAEEPFNKHKPALCPQLFIKSPLPFHRVFANEAYVVLRLHSQYVEIKPITHYQL